MPIGCNRDSVGFLPALSANGTVLYVAGETRPSSCAINRRWNQTWRMS